MYPVILKKGAHVIAAPAACEKKNVTAIYYLTFEALKKSPMSGNESSVKFGLLQFASATVAGYLFFQRRNKRSNSLQVAPFTENVFYPPLPEPIVGILK
jgi:hypothetical protein